jgi:hypothetical protein
MELTADQSGHVVDRFEMDPAAGRELSYGNKKKLAIVWLCCTAPGAHLDERPAVWTLMQNVFFDVLREKIRMYRLFSSHVWVRSKNVQQVLH